MYKKVIKERDKFEKLFLKIFGDAIQELHLNQDKIKMRAYTILGAINWIPRWYSPKGKLSAAQIGEMMADYFVGRLEGKS
jgi:TetR/AcrR family transcriptional regulator